MAAVTVIVSRHALDRVRARYPELAELPDQELHRLIGNEVTEALEDGRQAKRSPRWAAWTYMRRARRPADADRKGSRWFVWPITRDRLYVVRLKQGRYIVVTAVPVPRPEERIA